MKIVRVLGIVLLLMLINLPAAFAEQDDYKFQSGPLKIDLDNGINTLDLPTGYSYLDQAESKKLLESWKEPYNERIIGIVVNDESGCIGYLEYDETGYIKDDDADQLDAEGLLESYREGTRESNKDRVEAGTAEIEIIGWDSPPRYDKKTHVLQWAIRGQEKGAKECILNHNAVLLGRAGTLTLVAAGSETEVAQMDALRTMLSQHVSFTSGNDYESFKQGDKVSDITLAGLVTGGAATAAYAAAKGGLLAKLAALLVGLKKLLIVIVLAVAALFKKIWDVIRNKKDEVITVPEANPPAEPPVNTESPDI